MSRVPRIEIERDDESNGRDNGSRIKNIVGVLAGKRLSQDNGTIRGGPAKYGF